MNAFDSTVMEFVSSHHTPILNYFFSFITKLGDLMIVWIFLIVALFVYHKKLKELKYIIPIFAVSFFVNDFVIKNLVKRTRPYEQHDYIKLLIERQSSYSFPSGHSMTSFMAATVLAYYFPKYKLAFYILATLIAFSRVYVGVHYPSDIIAGALVGFGCAIIGIKIMEKIRTK
ncbi:MAG: phosphatase PAP2 family protein [Erysipelotrichales bacterium]